MTIEERIKKILEDLFNRKIGDSFAQKNEDDWDSLMQLDIISQLEVEFGVNLSPREIGGMTSFGSIVEIIRSKLETNE